MITDYVVGNAVRARATVRDKLTGQLVAPDNLSFYVRSSGGVQVYVLGVDAIVQTVVAPGVYDLIYPLANAGKVSIRAIATGLRPLNAVAQIQVDDPGF